MLLKPIYSSISRAAAISLLLLWATTLQAQTSRRPATQKAALTEADTIPLFRGVAISLDLVGVAQKALGDYGQYEAAARINLRDRYFPVVEIGLGKADASDVNTSLSYHTSAPYARIGMDFNVLRNKHDINRAYIGGRYGFTSFKYDVAGTAVNDPVWGDQVAYEYQGNKSTCHWLEVVAGIDARICGPLRMGWSVRYKRKMSTKVPDIGKPWYIPGYGREGARLGATFHITFEL